MAGRPRVVILSYSDGLHDARSLRVARSLAALGCDVEIFSRHARGLPYDEVVDGFPVHRYPVPFAPPVGATLELVGEWIAAGGRRRWLMLPLLALTVVPALTVLAALGALSHVGDRRMRERSPLLRESRVLASVGRATDRLAAGYWRTARALPSPLVAPLRPAHRWLAGRLRRLVRALRATLGRASAPALPTSLARSLRRRSRDVLNRAFGPLLMFPLRPLAWAVYIERAVGEAAVYHGMWAGSLPALVRLRKRHRGGTIYDSRDVYMHSRSFARLRAPLRGALLDVERRWAQRVDRVLTVNDAYADILVEELRIARPTVVMNCPFRQPLPRRSDRLAAALGLAERTDIVLYQGNMLAERGIEQAMEAILEVPSAVLVLLGGGSSAEHYAALAADPRYAAQVRYLPPVPAHELLEWTAGADVMVSVIQPTTLNHLHTTPQKLFEALAVGVPIVASDMPGMAPIVRETGAGELVDPTDPAAIAAAIRRLLAESPEQRAARRRRIWQAAAAKYSWDAQEERLLALYRPLLGQRPTAEMRAAVPAEPGAPARA